MSESSDAQRMTGPALMSLPGTPRPLAPVIPPAQAQHTTSWRTLANALTCGVFILGVAALGARDQPGTATLCLILAGLLDSLDGACARRAGGATGYGAALDLVADFTAFALVPAALIRSDRVHFDAWLVPALVLFLAAAAARLVRSCRSYRRPHKVGFAGLPMPAAGLLVLALSFLPGPLLAASIVIVSALAISRRPYPSVPWLWRHDRSVLVVVALAAAAVSTMVSALALVVVTVVYATYPWLRTRRLAIEWNRKESGMQS